MNRESRVVVSGIGLVTALGQGREKTWSALLNGKTGICLTGRGLEASILDYSPNGACSRLGDLALQAAQEALSHARLAKEDLLDQEIGCAISQSKPILSGHSDAPGHLNPTLLLSSFSGWSAGSVVKRSFQLSGPSGNFVAACATGVASLEMAAFWIRSGQCAIALAGALESSLHPLYRSGFEQMGVLARGAPDQVKAFDRNRSGFAMGEGGAVLVLEREEAALRRGVQPLAVLEKIALRHSAHDALQFDSNGHGVAQLIHACVGQEGRPDYINAHGTGTRFNDRIEAKGIRLAYGDDADQIAVSSTKPSTGHLLGAAGAVEAAFCVLALRDQVAPPTLHLADPDPDCPISVVGPKAQSAKIRKALSLSYGFGGQMGAVLFANHE